MKRAVVFVCLFVVACAAGAAMAATPGEPELKIAQATGETPLPLPGPASGQQGTGTGTATEPPIEDLTQPDPNQPQTGEDGGINPDDLSLGEIPVVETMELTADIAKRAVDVYILVKTKYANSDLESYENLQDFVDQSPQGKDFDADIKAAQFASVNDWNLAITTVGFAYTGVVDDQSADLRQQIAEIEADTELAKDMKDRMVASLNAMIPSDNNKKVIEDLLKDPAYVEKLKQLDTEEE